MYDVCHTHNFVSYYVHVPGTGYNTIPVFLSSSLGWYQGSLCPLSFLFFSTRACTLVHWLSLCLQNGRRSLLQRKSKPRKGKPLQFPAIGIHPSFTKFLATRYMYRGRGTERASRYAYPLVPTTTSHVSWESHYNVPFSFCPLLKKIPMPGTIRFLHLFCHHEVVPRVGIPIR